VREDQGKGHSKGFSLPLSLRPSHFSFLIPLFFRSHSSLLFSHFSLQLQPPCHRTSPPEMGANLIRVRKLACRKEAH